MTDATRARPREDLVAIGAISFTILALQLIQIRIFSFAVDPVLVWCAISVALLGMGVGGGLVAVRPSLATATGARALVGCLLGFSITALVMHAWFARGGGIALSWRGVPWLLGFALPYLFGGVAVAIVLSRSGKRPYVPYLFNLLGSAFGCIALYPLMRPLGIEALLGIVAAVPALAGLWIATRARATGLAAVAAVCAIGAAACGVFGERVFPFRPDDGDLYARAHAALERTGATADPEQVYSAWDPVGRVQVHQFPRPFGTVDDRPVRLFSQDAGAGSILISLGDDQQLRDTLFETTVYGAAYKLRPEPKKMLIIGIGGAPDVLCALHHDVPDVTGIEINRAVLDVVTNAQASFLGGPFPPHVKLLHMDGRSFVEQTTEKYDLLQMTGADTISAGSGGAFLFSENYLYTKEAFRRYWSILDDDGLLSIIRFGMEPFRVVTTAIEVMQEHGIERPDLHMIVIQQGIWVSTMFSKQPITPDAIERIKAMIAASTKRPTPLRIPIYETLHFGLNDPMVLVWAPNRFTNPRYNNFMLAAIAHKWDDAARAMDLDCSFAPISDDRPFFFNFLSDGQISGVFALDDNAPSSWGMRQHLKFLLTVIIASAVCILGPLVLLTRRGLPGARVVPAIACFGALGLGYLFVELALLQRTALLLGHPTYSAAATLFTLLAATGLGSLFSSRFKDADPGKTVAGAVLALLALLVTYDLFLGDVLRTLLAYSFSTRLIAVVVLLAPAGFIMGIPFPTALRVVSNDGPSVVAWGLAINSFASVVASLLTSVIAMLGGFTSVLRVAAALYAVAAITLWIYVRQQASSSARG